MTIIAGHVFQDTPGGRQCMCGRLWVQISGVTREDIGQLNIAHVGALNVAEYEQIKAECDRIHATIVGVVRG